MSKALIFWFTGLSGSGKTTIVNRMVEGLRQQNKKVKVFDGDVVRREKNNHLTFSPSDIKENNRLIVEMCLENRELYDYIFVPIIAPFQESRDYARRMLGPSFFLVYCSADLKTVSKRDPKGLYAKVKAGKIDNFIGIHKEVPYQVPDDADLVLETGKEDVLTSINKMTAFFQRVNGPLLHALNEAVGELTLKIAKDIKNLAYYQQIEQQLGSEKLLMFLKLNIAIEIKPFIKQLLAQQAQLPATFLFPLKNDFSLGRQMIRSMGKKAIAWVDKILALGKFTMDSEKEPTIAVHYSEGVDFERRSDIAWFKNSGIKPQQLLIYFDGLDSVTRQPISETVLAQIEAMGIRWVALKRGVVSRHNKNVWAPPLFIKTNYRIKKPRNHLEQWIYRQVKKLVAEINYWQAFYRAFNVKLLLLPEQGSPPNIAQGIAFDLMSKNAGFTLGKQRSDLGVPRQALVGHHTKDVYFAWNNRSAQFLKSPYNLVRSMVVTGNQNDHNFNGVNEELRDEKLKLQKNGAKFIIALFDTGQGNPLNRTVASMEMEVFYRSFIEWLLKDKSLGLVIKSKKPYVINSLPNIPSLLAQAEATGRCLRLPHEFGRMPTDASKISDIAVGIGINSAVTEAVIAGCKGIHYLNSFPCQNEYYQWGFEQLVFNDLTRMISELQAFKAAPEANPGLGDWSKYLDKLDPFRDGVAGERMGKYMHWLLESFTDGLSREDILKKANERYAAVWGNDRIAVLSN